jgi:hypothetical protein
MVSVVFGCLFYSCDSGLCDTSGPIASWLLTLANSAYQTHQCGHTRGRLSTLCFVASLVRFNKSIQFRSQLHRTNIQSCTSYVQHTLIESYSLDQPTIVKEIQSEIKLGDQGDWSRRIRENGGSDKSDSRGLSLATA